MVNPEPTAGPETVPCPETQQETIQTPKKEPHLGSNARDFLYLWDGGTSWVFRILVLRMYSGLRYMYTIIMCHLNRDDNQVGTPKFRE